MAQVLRIVFKSSDWEKRNSVYDNLSIFAPGANKKFLIGAPHV